PLRRRQQSPDKFVELFMPFSLMMATRAAAHLWKSSKDYVYEDPLELDEKEQKIAERAAALEAEGKDREAYRYRRVRSFNSKSWRAGAGARWVAATIRETALAQGTPAALIPADGPLDSPQQRIQYDPKEIDYVAINILGMDEAKIRRTLAR